MLLEVKYQQCNRGKVVDSPVGTICFQRCEVHQLLSVRSQGLFVASCCAVALVCKNQAATPPRSLGMCGLIKLLVYRQGVTDVLHVTRQEIKETRKRLTAEDWTIYHTELI